MHRSAIVISTLLTFAPGLLAVAGSRSVAPAGDQELMQSAPTVVATGVTTPVIAAGHRLVWMEVTAYCACTKCCGPRARGVTASGLPVTHNLGRFAAADAAVLPIGSSISVPGYHDGQPIPVIDRGGAIKGNKLDVFFPTHEQALKWGRRWVQVTIGLPETGVSDSI